MKTKKIILFGMSSFVFLCFNCKRPTLGLTNGQFKACPESPNCVTSMAKLEDKQHYADPFKMKGGQEDSYQTIKRILTGLPRVTIITDKMPYIHAEFKTKFMRYIDDVEFYFDESSGLIHYRSASRVGHSDLGLNRRRMEDIRDRYYRLIDK